MELQFEDVAPVVVALRDNEDAGPQIACAFTGGISVLFVLMPDDAALSAAASAMAAKSFETGQYALAEAWDTVASLAGCEPIADEVDEWLKTR